MINLHIFTEEASAKNIFDAVVPKIISQEISFSVYPHQGKQDLHKALKTTIPSISKIPGARILITRDQDAADCRDLKKQINAIVADNCKCPYRIRIVCRELESWLLGDLAALQKSYPRFKAEMFQGRSHLKNVDNVQSPPNLLLSIIPELKGRSTLPKLEVSEIVAPNLDIDNNLSGSFNNTVKAIKELIAVKN